MAVKRLKLARPRLLASLSFKEMKAKHGVLVQGDPATGRRTLIDGTFDLAEIMRCVIVDYEKSKPE